MKVLERGPGPWVLGLVVTIVFHVVMTFLPVDLTRAPAKERPAVQLFMEPPKEPSAAEAQPPEPEVQEPEEPKRALKPKKRRKKKAKPKVEPKPEPVEAPEPVEEPVEEAEPVEKVVESPPPAPKPVQVNLGPYGRSLHSAVQRKQRYPRAARMMRMEGTVEVEMRVYVDGRLASEPKVSRSSGHELLDKEALRMVRAAAPFPNLPDGFIGETARFKVPVRFALNP